MGIHQPLATPAPAAPLDVPAHVELAAKSGCSTKTFVAIFGGNVDLAEHDGWHLAMVAGCTWTAKRGKRTLRANTLGGIHAKVKQATRSPLPRSLPRTVSATPATVEACGGESRVAWDGAKGSYVWAVRDGEGSAPHALPGVV